MRSVTRGLLGVFVLLTASIGSAADLFSTHFTDETLRIDYFHSGDAQSETATLDRLLRQGQWAGSRSHLIDESRLGSYAVEVREKSTDLLIFSRGFDSYFAEYQTTGAATSGTARTYHESVLVPFPQHPVSIALVKRPRTGSTREISRFDVDPHSPLIALEPPRQGATIVEELVNGDVHSKVDIAFIGEGYTEADTKLFKQDLKRLSSALLAQEPFSAQRRSFNIRGVLAPSNHAGCDEPTRGIYRDTALAASFNSLGSSRYLLTEDNRALRDIAANVPYDALIIMVNHQRYGGGGIYNFYCVFTAHNHWSSYLLVHEFGHSFTGLADEYYTSSVAYNDFYPRGVEPAEPNITALLEPGNLKWKDLVSDGTSLPTPWEKASFDELENSYQT
ncbi:MAG: peptidase M64, partial [bacterium]|nr:peptidase M64 [bacterium]